MHCDQQRAHCQPQVSQLEGKKELLQLQASRVVLIFSYANMLTAMLSGLSVCAQNKCAHTP